jgi:hypothetical protein
MHRLFIKDYFLHKRSTFIFFMMLTGYCIWISFTIPPALVYAGFSAVFISMIPILTLAREDKLQSVALSCSLPVRRDEIVRYRYISGWLVTLAGLVYVFGLAFLIPGATIDLDELLSLGTVFFYLTIATFFLASVVPFVIRFGWTGLMIFLLGIQFLGVLALLIPVLFDLKGGMAALFRTLPVGIANVMQILGAPVFYLSLVLILIGYNLVSWKISTVFFRSRDL